MTIKKSVLVFYILVLCVIVFFIGRYTALDTKEYAIDHTIMDRVAYELIGSKEHDAGMTYTLTLTNNSEKTIAYNTVHLSYPIKTKNGSGRTTNNFMVEAKGNKLNIESGDKVILNAFMPAQVYEDNDLILQDEPMIRVVCYFEEVNEMTRHVMAGDLEGIIENTVD